MKLTQGQKVKVQSPSGMIHDFKVWRLTSTTAVLWCIGSTRMADLRVSLKTGRGLGSPARNAWRVIPGEAS